MATYPIKMLRDENKKPFVPMVSADSIYTSDGKSFEENFASKLEASDLKEGVGIVLEQDGNSTTISVDFGATDNIIDNLDTTVAGQGPLDARQGNVLKNMIPAIVDNLNSSDASKTLSANQGRILKDMSVPTGGSIGQVLKKASNNDHELEWGDAADPNAIVGNGSIMKIIELTYAEYKTLESNGELKEDTEYHITDVENGTATYLTTQDIEEIVYDKTANHTTENQVSSMIESSIVNNLTSTSTTKSLSAAQGQILNDKIELGSHLIAEVIATDYVSELTLGNLNLEPGTYEIVVAEWSDAGTGMGHVLRLNGATSGYQGIHMHPVNRFESTAESWRVAYHYNGLCYLNGWSVGVQLNYGVYTLHYFNQDWITITGETHLVQSPYTMADGKNATGKWNMIYQQGSYNGHSTKNITSLSITSLDSTKIGPDSYIRLYKK